MDGYILKFSEGTMDYPRVESYPTTYCAHTSTRQVILKLQQPQDNGNTPGVQSNFALSLMIWNWICGGKTCPPSPPSPPRTLWNLRRLEMKKICRHWSGMELCPHIQWTKLPPIKPRIHWKNPLSDLVTRAWPNLSSWPTSIVKFTMETKYKCPQSKWPDQVSMIKALNMSNPLWVQ